MILNIPNIAIGGVNSDIAPWDLPPEVMSAGLNFRTEANSVVSYGGHEILADTDTPYNPAFGILARTKYGNYMVFAGNNVISAYQTTFQDISGDSLSIPLGSEWSWSGCLNGAIIILNNSYYYPVYWEGGSGDVVDLPWHIEVIDSETVTTTWKDKGYSASVIRAHKNYLIALDLDDTTLRPDSFRWSHSADENGIPFTWDPDETSANAGIQALGGDGGRIIDGLSLRDSFVIYSEKAINILDLSGDEFIWRRRELSSTVGLISRNCVVEVKGIHYLMTHGDIVTFDGNNITSIAHNAIQTRIKRINTDVLDRAFVFSNDKRKEIWFCVPEDNNTTPSVALIYQWKQQTWSIRDLPDNTGYIVTAPELQSQGEPWDYYPDGPESPLDPADWEFDNTLWSEGVARITFQEHPYAVNHGNSEIHLLDAKEPIDDLDVFLERTNLPIEGQVNITTLTRLYPHIEGSNLLRIRVGSQDRPGGRIRWKPYKDFNPDPDEGDRKLDVRSTGALHCYRIESIGKGNFRLAGLDIEYEVDGIR